MNWSGISCQVCLLTLLLIALTSGCTGLFAEKGIVLRYLDSGHHEITPATHQQPVPDGRHITPITPDQTMVTTQPTITAYNTPSDQQVSPPEQSKEPVEYRTFDFRYRTTDYSVRLPVNMSLYYAANQSSKAIAGDNPQIGTVYRQIVEDPGTSAFLDEVVPELRRQKFKGGKTLTDDEYLEFLVSFVQQIPYDNTTQSPRYPVEVMYDMKGDCDEKSLLLTSILSREGYDTSLLLFPAFKHATAGIRIHLATANPPFRVFSDGNRDYIYIETTTTRLIGIYPDEYVNASEPVVVPLGNGNLQYRKMDDIISILYDLKTIRTNIADLNAKAAASGSLMQWDYNARKSYIETYNYVMSTNDRIAVVEAIRESELPHHSACMSCR